MYLRTLETIDAIDAVDWNRCCGSDYPFLRHEFLLALEQSISLGPGSGWLPEHQVLFDNLQRAVAVMPCYLKDHSWGEYVFDWSWAHAYQRHGVSYYPKLVSAIPFTPATGPRLALAPDAQATSAGEAMQQGLESLMNHHKASSWHLLFPDTTTQTLFDADQVARRTGVQYHWFNRGYCDFEEFLGRLKSRRRKSIRRERRRVSEQGLELQRLLGTEIDAALWHDFYRFYQNTYALRSGHGGYLSEDFFHRVGANMGEQIMMVVVRDSGRLVAAALNFIGSDTLYGRYWGCSQDYDQLHFETCYYQGIEFCIEQGLSLFDAGAQGEHKLKRGFEPVATHSLHRIAHPGFREAIGNFLREEEQAILDWIKDASLGLAYRDLD